MEWHGFFFPPQITSSQRKKMKHKMKVELHKLNAMSETEAYAIQDLWQLDMNSRWRLYRWQRYFIWGLSSKGVRDCQSSNTFLQAKVFYSYMFSLLSEQTFSCKIFAFTPPALAGQCCHLYCVHRGLSTDASHVFHKGQRSWTESTLNFWITVLSSFLWVLMALSSQALAADLSGTYSTEDSSARTAVPGSSWKAGRTEAARRSLHSEGGQSCGDDNYRCAAFGEQASAALLPAIVKGPCCQRIAILCCLTDWVRLHVNLQPSSFLIPFANVAIAETSFQFAQAVFYLLLSNILIILMLHFLCLS